MMKHFCYLRYIIIHFILVIIVLASQTRARSRYQDRNGNRNKAVKLIIDTDFGGPIDDTWAIAYALKEQEIYNTFNIRLINTVGRNTTARSLLLANFVQRSQYKYNIDIGIGIPGECNIALLDIGCAGWAYPYLSNNFTLDDYNNGLIYYDGNQRIIDIIENEGTLRDPIYIITIGPMTNIEYIFSPLYLNRTDLKKYVRMFSMSGSLFKNSFPFGFFVEFNILDDINAARYTYNNNDFFKNLCVATWDTGVLFQIKENEYSQLLESINNNNNNNNLLVKEMIDMYEIWYINGGFLWAEGNPFLNESVKMFDLEMIIMASLVANIDIGEKYKSCRNITDYINVETKYVFVNNSGYVIDREKININFTNFTNFTKVDFAVNFTLPGGVESLSQYATSVFIAQLEQDSPSISSSSSSSSSSQDSNSDDSNGN